jgi:NAD(P)-dependent dehydrogenase (short-subunit alcohol dehydrogenase family)
LRILTNHGCEHPQRRNVHECGRRDDPARAEVDHQYRQRCRHAGRLHWLHLFGVQGAVLAVTRSAATELGEKGIRVNAISPGGVVTGIFDKNVGLEGSKADKVTDVVRSIFGRLQPIRRAGETSDIANAAAFLAGDEASFVNGHDFVVDGGITANVVGWTERLELRAELGAAIKAAAAD